MVDEKPMESSYELELQKHGSLSLALPEEEVSRTEQRRLLRKLDCILLPLASGCVLLQMLDKTLLNYAGIMNLQSDLHLQSSDFSWLGSIFYFGYLAGTFLHSYFLQHAPLSPYLSVVVVVWGAILTCHAAATNFSAFMAVRFFLGFMEATINPGFILLTGRFYKRSEQVTRTAVWYSMNGWAMIVGGSMTYGILVHPAPIMNRWKEMFIGVGCVTMAFGLLCLFIMPSSPETTHYLNERERSVAILRIASNQSGIHDKKFKWYQFKEAVLDIRLYIFFFAFGTVNISNGGISIFATQIINAFGFDPPQAALLDMSKGLAEVVAVVIGSAMFLLWKRRDIPCIFGYIVAIVGGVMMTALDSSLKVTRVAGLSLVYFFPISYPMFYSWMNGCVSGTTKRIVFNAVLQIAYCVGNIIGPQFYPSEAHADYTAATTVDYVMFAVSAGLVMMLSCVHYAWNRSRDQQSSAKEWVDPQEQLANDLSDMTDKERPTYRYPY